MVNNFEEIFTRSFDLHIWRDGYIEESLRQMPRDSFAWRAYERSFLRKGT